MPPGFGQGVRSEGVGKPCGTVPASCAAGLWLSHGRQSSAPQLHIKPCLPDPPRIVFLIVVVSSWNGQMTSSDSWIVRGNLQWIVGLIIVL